MISKVVFLLKYFIVAIEQGNLKENLFKLLCNNQTLSVIIYLCHQIVHSVDTIFLLNLPVLNKFTGKLNSIEKTFIGQKSRKTLKHRTSLHKNH